jgi:hypothetical protein
MRINIQSHNHIAVESHFSRTEYFNAYDIRNVNICIYIRWLMDLLRSKFSCVFKFWDKHLGPSVYPFGHTSVIYD